MLTGLGTSRVHHKENLFYKKGKLTPLFDRHIYRKTPFEVLMIWSLDDLTIYVIFVVVNVMAQIQVISFPVRLRSR